MIIYNLPSARLGLLNEENFTSDPTARGWAVSGLGGYTYGAGGVTVMATSSTTKSVILELDGTQLTQYIAFSVSGSTGSGDNITMYYALYFDGVLVKQSNDVGPADNFFISMYSLFKNTPTDWKQYYTFCYGDEYTDDSSGYSEYTTTNIGKSLVNKITLMLYVKTGSGEVGAITLTNLKWV